MTIVGSPRPIRNVNSANSGFALVSVSPCSRSNHVKLTRLLQARVLRTVQGTRRECVIRYVLVLRWAVTDICAAPFQGGTWKIHVELPDQYPYKSPSIGFVNRIYHPNIDEL